MHRVRGCLTFSSSASASSQSPGSLLFSTMRQRRQSPPAAVPFTGSHSPGSRSLHASSTTSKDEPASPRPSSPASPRSRLGKSGAAALAVAAAALAAYGFHSTTTPLHPPGPSSSSPSSSLSSSFEGLVFPPLPQHPSRLFFQSGEEASLTTGKKWVTRALRENQRQWITDHAASPVASGRILIDSNSVASNEPVEDRHVHVQVQLPFMHQEKKKKQDPLLLVGVIDGHAGWKCSHELRHLLPSYAAHYLSQVQKESVDVKEGEKVDRVKRALERAFVDLDQHLLDASQSERYSFHLDAVEPAVNGAVALLTVLWDKDLFVSNCGDVMAVLGSWMGDKVGYKATPLSQEHNGDNLAEKARVISEHPEEEKNTSMVRNRVLGHLHPTRVFGDARYKLTKEQMEALGKLADKYKSPVDWTKRYLIPELSKTPPYVKSFPEVTHHALQPADRFLIVATDGLWDWVRPEKAVEIVGEYMAKQKQDPAFEKKFKNAATYLLHQALGEVPDRVQNETPDSHRVKVLALPAGYSRRYRDDITVSVVFFSEEGLAKREVTSGEQGEMGVGAVPVVSLSEKLVTWPEILDARLLSASSKL